MLKSWLGWLYIYKAAHHGIVTAMVSADELVREVIHARASFQHLLDVGSEPTSACVHPTVSKIKISF